MIVKDTETFIISNCINPTQYLQLKKKWVKEIRIVVGEEYLSNLETEEE